MVMRHTAGTVALLAAIVAVSPACQSSSGAPLTPSAASGVGRDDVAGAGVSLKASAPLAQSPVNAATITTLTPTLVVSGGGLTYSTAAVQYRFRVTDAAGAIAADSGLVSGTSWTVPAPLTPTSRYTWSARSEYRGLTGPWSAAFTFTTPVAPGNDYGAWESTCQGRVAEALVNCVWNFVRPTNSVEDFEVSKRVAWLLRGQGGALLLKSGGENVVPWLSRDFSAARICILPQGHLYKIIGDAGPGGANSPGWSDNDLVDPSTCVAAIDPRLR